jgi:hypothetical protein
MSQRAIDICVGIVATAVGALVVFPAIGHVHSGPYPPTLGDWMAPYVFAALCVLGTVTVSVCLARLVREFFVRERPPH